MHFESQTARLLHDEHLNTISTMSRLEEFLSKYRPNKPPAFDEPAFKALLGPLRLLIANDAGRHFDFEENSLFPLLEDMGEMGITSLLRDEHHAIRSLTPNLQKSLSQFEDGDISVWPEICRLGNELAERQIAHIQKETMALLPMLEQLMEADMDSELSTEYAMSA